MVIKGGHSWLHLFEYLYEENVVDKLTNVGDDFLLKLKNCTTNFGWMYLNHGAL